MNEGIKFVQQYKFKDCKNIRELPFDFFLPEYNVCLEYDGIQHYDSVEYFGGLYNLKKRKINDNIKNEFCEKNQINLIKIKYNQNIEKELYSILIVL